MRIETTVIEGVVMNILVLEEGDEADPCENCGEPNWIHPDLAGRDDADWCLNCNDEERLKRVGQARYDLWVTQQIISGKAILIATEGS